ncbi:hypothetical protein [Pyrodictium abyssi]|uniref:Uncharacterized protein n=1 Tax=Pyrodictium abyssi TaxID=54256 RepID=A0ABM8ISM6_9CREN|nr:hypothetical protein PABY_01340 [Pyrodictium abyssi]
MAPPFYTLQGIILQLERGIRVVRRLPKLQHLDTRLLRGVIADFLKDLSHLAVYSQLQGLGDERFYGVVARCSRLFTEVGRAVSTLEALAELQRVDLPRATKRLAETLAADPCLEELEKLLAEVKNTMDTRGQKSG